MGKWEMVRLGDAANINMGQSPESSTYNQIEEGVPFYQGNADFGERYPVKRFWCTAPKKLSTKDDILISVRAPIGAMNFSIETCCIGRGLASITPKPKRLEKKYLWYILKSNYDFLNRQGTGSTFKAINKNVLTELLIPLPPLDEQKRIAKNLDLASEIVKGYKEQLVELDKLVQSVFYEMFGDPVTNEKGWDIKPLKNIAIGKLSYGSGASAIPFDGNIRYLRITDVNENGQLNNDVVSPSKYDNKYVLHDGDILFARSGATVGKTFRYSDTYGKCLYAGYLIRLIPDKTLVLPDYIFSFTKSQYYKRFIEKNMKVVAQPNINAQQYGDLDICVPPLPLQTHFASIVTDIEAQKAKIQHALTEAENLFNSLMQEYFE